MLLRELTIPLSEYVRRLSDQANCELDLKLILSPFGICYGDHPAEEGYLVGHFLDALADDFSPGALVDVYDVITCAWDLGFDAAGGFLDQGHLILGRHIQELKVSRVP